MKNFLFILGLLISFMLFAPEEGTKSMDEVMSATKEAVMKEKNTADVQRRFEVLSNELKSSNCLTFCWFFFFVFFFFFFWFFFFMEK